MRTRGVSASTGRGISRDVRKSSFTFQAPEFYQRHGYVETGRTSGIPGGAEDVHMSKRLGQASTNWTGRLRPRLALDLLIAASH